MMRKLIGAAVVLVACVGCSSNTLKRSPADEFDYRRAAEKAIDDSDQLTNGDCQQPTATKIGTTFTCTATVVADESLIKLTATIDESKHVTVGEYTGDD